MPDIPPDRRAQTAKAWLSRQGVEAGEAAAFVAEALGVIGDDRFAAAFGPNSRGEAPIVGEAAGKSVSGVVDRLAVDDERVTVIDFKTDRPPPKTVEAAPDVYVLQLALYREVLRKIFPGREIVCALLWTEAPQLMELPGQRLSAALDTFKRG